MKLGSLFDGSGGFPLAGTLCGIEPIWASEIEPYPIAVTKSRMPQMKHLGDISKINGAEIEPVDIITFGSPCQDLSVAGKRAGLKHQNHGDGETTRSGLFMEAIRIIKEMREKTNGEYPKFAMWENVPGAFSSNKGEDFRIVLEEIIKISEPNAVMSAVPPFGWAYADNYCGNGWSLAYRVLDAQHWGVPQRRRRIYLVADFRGQCAKEILFKREGVRGYFTQGRTPWKRTTANAERCVGADDRERAYGVVTKGNGDAFRSSERHTSLSSGGGQAGQGYPCVMESAGFCPEQSAKTRSIGYEEEISPTLRSGVTPGVAYSIENHPNDSRVDIDESGKTQTLTSRMGTGGGNVPMVMEPQVYEWHNQDSRIQGPIDVACTLNTNAGGREGHLVLTASKASFFMRTEEELASTLVATDYKDPQMVCYCIDGDKMGKAERKGGSGLGICKDVCYTLTAKDVHSVAYGLDRASFDQGANAKFDFSILREQQPTLMAKGPGAVCKRYIVRRLTPTECARLQGFADRWGDVDHKTEFSDEEYMFWLDVRNSHATINGKKTKEYTKTQMLTWYNKLHTDSAEYKMWGNGIALPTALYVMQGIKEALNESYQN